MDYQAWYNLKKTQIWKQTLRHRDRKLYIKSKFDSLKDKYNYIEYRNSIRNDIVIKTKIQMQIDNKGLQYATCLWMYYITEVYISFMIQYVLAQQIKDQYSIDVEQNTYLDIVLKADLKFNENYYQIKNVSFLENEYTQQHIAQYRSKNPNLLFIFYKVTEKNIYFCTFNDRLFIPVNQLDSWVIHQQTKYITLNQAAAAAAAERKRQCKDSNMIHNQNIAQWIE